jgi:hypothetical protein
VAAPTTIKASARPEGGTLLRREPLDEDDQPRARWERAIGWGIVAIATWLVFCLLDANHNWTIHLGHFRFGDLFLNTTTNGGDMGAHVWWPKFLADHWFSWNPLEMRLSGWAPDWYAGFPVGQYYFPLPALMIWVLDTVPFVPYNVAFKLVTVTGPLLLPAGAYSFARGIRAPWPAPPAFALAALGMLMETRTDWQIYGGNIASTLAGEFSFTIGLALALFGLGALAYTLDTGRRRWLPAVLIAGAVMSHIVVALFLALAALLLWLTRRPFRSWRIAAWIGGVAIAIPAVWLVPLLGNSAYTQSMRYTKLVPKGTFTTWSWLPLPTPVRDATNDFVRALGTYLDPVSHKHLKQPLWLPWWIWLLAAVAIVAAGWYRRRSTLVLLVLALVMGVLFVQWPADFAVWNTRFLPFWLLTWGFLAAMGATEICRWVAQLVRWSYEWIRDGDLQDARARAWAEIATADDDAALDPAVRKSAAWALAERRFDVDPLGWQPPPHLAPERTKQRAKLIGSIALATVVGVTGIVALNRGWAARNGNPAIAISGWAAWNYSGYESASKPAEGQYFDLISKMDEVAHTHGDGRALWEPSSGDPDAINSYGTSLALELLPYFTQGRIDSMEGIYFESSATTSYHFLTVAECSQHPSNPVRGLKYGTPSQDFDLCVRHLQMLGVRYLMLWTPESQAKADQSRDLTLVKTIPGPIPGTKLEGWKVYQVANSDLVVGMHQEPVVAKVHGGDYSKCWGTPFPDSTSAEPHLPAWECTVAPWWTDRSKLDIAFAQSGPPEWQRVDGRDLGSVQPKTFDPVEVTGVHRSVKDISFHVSEVGKPVVVKESYFPNWHAKGAKGPYRLAPNLMVVVPTSNDVTLSYGLTKYDWLGRVLTLLGLIGLLLLGLWAGAQRFAAGPQSEHRPADGEDGRDDGGRSGEGEGNGGDADTDDEGEDPGRPPDPKRWEPAPALP